MIRGVNSLFYTSEAVVLRAFIRDKLGFSGSAGNVRVELYQPRYSAHSKDRG